MLRHYSHLSSQYDDALSAIPHYALYPEMTVAVGADYAATPCRILVLGESHYLEHPEPNNTPAGWYERRALVHDSSPRWISTRGIVNNVIAGKNPSRAKAIYHALASALQSCQLARPDARSPLQTIAYMNFFQRPAEATGKSIIASARDAEVSADVVGHVASVLAPHLVMVVSSLAWKHARRGLVDQLAQAGIPAAGGPHPATSWWNRPSKATGGLTGRQRFIEVVNARLRQLDCA